MFCSAGEANGTPPNPFAGYEGRICGWSLRGEGEGKGKDGRQTPPK